MPKHASSSSVKLQKIIKEFGQDVFATDGQTLICKYCSIQVSFAKKYYIQQHLQREKHKAAAALNEALKIQPISSFLTANSEKNKFFTDLTKMMVACDIPLFKANHKEFKTFFENYSKKKLPDESTIRKNYLKDVYEEVLQKIRDDKGDSKIFISIDESTDKASRFVCNVIVGPLRKNCRGYLLTSEVIQKVNASEIATIFDNSLRILWPEQVKRENVLVFITDAARYMKKCGEALKLLYPKMIHITCLAHGVHRVCEKLRSIYPDVDALIANIKKIFLKCASRVFLFKEMDPELPLPPQPVLTRWGTWLSAASYYARNFTRIKYIVDELDEDAACITFAKSILADDRIRAQLAYIQTNFGFLVDPKNSTFDHLQKRGQPIGKILSILHEVENNLKQAKGPIAMSVFDKFNSVFSENKGLQVIKDIADVVGGLETAKLPKNIEVNDVESFNWAPLVSVDVERSFSTFKNMLRDNRMRMLPKHFKMHLVALCYYNASEEH